MSVSLNVSKHTSQMYGFSPLCSLERLSVSLNVSKHTSQLSGYSLLCSLECFLNVSVSVVWFLPTVYSRVFFQSIELISVAKPASQLYDFSTLSFQV